jgi:very-short-patch-repair endonuclease
LCSSIGGTLRVCVAKAWEGVKCINALQDGSQHLDQQEYDDERTKHLESRGYRVLRFWNNDVLNKIDDVLKVIWSVLREENEEEKRQP